MGGREYTRRYELGPTADGGVPNAINGKRLQESVATTWCRKHSGCCHEQNASGQHRREGRTGGTLLKIQPPGEKLQRINRLARLGRMPSPIYRASTSVARCVFLCVHRTRGHRGCCGHQLVMAAAAPRTRPEQTSLAANQHYDHREADRYTSAGNASLQGDLTAACLALCGFPYPALGPACERPEEPPRMGLELVSHRACPSRRGGRPSLLPVVPDGAVARYRGRGQV